MEKRPIRIEGEIAYVPLPDGTEAIIDAEDAELVGKHNWCLNSGYVMTTLPLGSGKYRALLLHRLVMGEPEGKMVDHRNGNKLDNRKAFLRPATVAENGSNQGIPRHNTSGRKGVSWHKDLKKWQASIQHEGKKLHLGYFTDLEEAAQAYCQAALKHHGEFARI
jgi:hypothetical protein